MDHATEDGFPWVMVLAAFLVVGLLSATGALSMQRIESQPLRVGPTVIAATIPWIAWGLLAWPIAQLVRRFPVLPPVARNLLAHAALALVLVTLQMLFTVWLNRLLFAAASPRQESFGFWFAAYVANRGVWNLLVYAGLVALFQGMETRSRLRRQEVAAARLEAQLAQAQLHALHQQLQPHFLFNTLHAIGVLNQEDPARATQMIAALGDLLRSSLETRSASEIPLGQELGLLEQYLAIEAMRFSDRLTVAIDVPTDVRRALVPPFTLQPLAENAIRHGIARSTGAGSITVTGGRSGDLLELAVWNSGPPLSGNGRTEGVGLATTRARLSHLHGATGTLDLSNRDGGVAATLRLPYHEQPAR